MTRWRHKSPIFMGLAMTCHAMIAPLMTWALLVGLRTDAGASQWGCEVLLCASASNPSWRSIPACHPPMRRLLAAMDAPGFSWPTCPEAGSGRPGYRRYGPCPAGWRAEPARQERGGQRTGELCVRQSQDCPRTRTKQDDCAAMRSMPRPVRQMPYYFDLEQDDGTISRHWFALDP